MSLTLILGLPALLCALLAVALLRRPRHPRARAMRLLAGLVMALVAMSLGTLAVTLMQFERITHDTPVAQISLTQTGPQQFDLHLVAEGIDNRYAMLGDEWQLDARVIRWRLPALLSGAPPAYRLERISGRYSNVELERQAERSAYPLAPSGLPDLFDLKRSHPRWLPFVDARWGSAAYLPMLDGARYDVSLSPLGGLIARPADEQTEARMRAAGW